MGVASQVHAVSFVTRRVTDGSIVRKRRQGGGASNVAQKGISSLSARNAQLRQYPEVGI